tara:strand:- start:515 stop:664 length:150 start_codon:yes stop_codon:yes gene_type:complete
MPTGVTSKTQNIVDFRLNRRIRAKKMREDEQKNELKEVIKTIIKTQHNK